MDQKKQRVLQAQLDETQKRELELSRKLAAIPEADSKREFLLRELSDKVMERAMSVPAANFDDETQSFDFTFSSEYLVDRWFGKEKLIHTAEAADLGRLNDGGAFCIDHDAYSGHIGTHEKAWIDVNERVGRGRARLSKNNPRAVQEYLDIKDVIRVHISVRYRILDLVIYQYDDRPDEYHITRWEVLENSTVAIPADPTVAVGRELELPEQSAIEPNKEESRMDPKNKPEESTPDVDVIRNEARADGEAQGREAGEKAAQERMSKMLDVGAKFGQLEKAREFISAGRTYEELVDACLESREASPPPSGENIGLSEEEAQRFSFLKLIRSQASPNNAALREDAAFELEAVDAARSKQPTGKRENGMPLPFDVMRAQQTVVGSDGGFMVNKGTSTSMIEDLVNAIKLFQLGARPFGDLVGTLDIPKDLGGVEGYVVGEDEAPDTSTAGFGLIQLVAKTVAARMYATRSMMNQTSYDMEMDMRRKIVKAIALKFDSLGLVGTGGRWNPLGLFNWPGVPIVSGGTDGAEPTRDHLVKLQTQPDTANALVGNLAFLTSALVRGKLMMTPEHPTANVGGWTWKEGPPGDPTVGSLIGYPAHVSNQVPDDLTKGNASAICSAIAFGNWDDFVVATWGSPEILVDPFTSSSKGGTWITAFQDMDTAVQRAKSFALMKDALAQ